MSLCVPDTYNAKNKAEEKHWLCLCKTFHFARILSISCDVCCECRRMSTTILITIKYCLRMNRFFLWQTSEQNSFVHYITDAVDILRCAKIYSDGYDFSFVRLFFIWMLSFFVFLCNFSEVYALEETAFVEETAIFL